MRTGGPGPAPDGRRGLVTRLALAVLGTLIALFGGTRTARAGVDVDVEFGHGGMRIGGAATPVIVHLRNASNEPVTVSVRVAPPAEFGSEAFSYTRSVLLGPGTVRRETFLVAGAAGYTTGGSVSLETDPRVPVRSRAKIGDRGRLEIPSEQFGAAGMAIDPAVDRVVGVIHDASGAIGGALDEERARNPDDQPDGAPPREPRRRYIPVSAAILRFAPLSLDGIEALVVCDPDESFCASPAEADALLDWVALGGRLVVSLGEQAPAFASSPLAASLPLRWSGTDRADYRALATALGIRADGNSGAGGPIARVTGLREGTEQIAAQPGMWVRARYGSGWIDVCTADLRQLLLACPPAPKEVRKVAAHILPAPPETQWLGRQPWEMNQFDAAERIGRAMRENAFRPPPFVAVAFGLILYVLVVGPLDWFVLRRMKKERLTTFTFAGAVCAFTAVAVIVSVFLFSTNEVVNRVVFLRYADGGRPGRELVSVRDVAGFYAPASADYTLEWALPCVVLGDALPGQSASGGVGTALPVVVTGSDPLRPKAGVEVAFRSQRVVHAFAAGPTGRTLVVRRGAGGADSVEVVNELGVPMTECFILRADGRIASLGEVPAGEARTSGAWISAYVAGLGNTQTEWEGVFNRRAAPDTDPQLRQFLATLVLSPEATGESCPAGWLALRRAGIVLDPPEDGRVIVVGASPGSPIPLPEGSSRGSVTVIVAKEAEVQ